MNELLPISFPMGQCWYVAYTRVRGELAASAHLTGLGFDCYAPLGRRRVHRRGCTTDHVVVMPRYLFIRFDINRDDWGQIRDCWDIQDLIRIDGIPIRVPDQVIEGMMALQEMGFYDEREAKHLSICDLLPGDKLKAIAGPFAEKVGAFVRASRKERVEILFGILKAELPLAHVVKV